MNDERIRVLCVDDSVDIARLYAAMVALEPDMESCGMLHAADELPSIAAERRPDVVLLDLTMPGRDPLDALREMTQRVPTARTIIFSGYDSEDVADIALAAGAWMLVSKHDDPTAVLAAIRAVAKAERRPVRASVV